MENINIILERENISNQIKTILKDFETNCKNVLFKKGIYIYGSPGCGKTIFVDQILKELNYDIIKYDAGDIRNKYMIETITSNNISNRNVLAMMNRKVKKIAIVMDEIDGMNSGDKGGITSLIKLIRQKKTKKQKLEDVTMNPIICIGNYFQDKKMKELMKVCHTFELKKPTSRQIHTILENSITTSYLSQNVKNKMVDYIQGDLRKIEFFNKLYNKNKELMNENLIDNILQVKSFNEDSKKTTHILLNNHVPFDKHNTFLNETDRTIIALLWHENIVNAISKNDSQTVFPFYLEIIDNICFADYIDRVTFQNQIWQFNEMSSLIKTFYNNKIYHERFPENEGNYNPSEIQFTKVLTKYSTEFNNLQFIYSMCQELDMDKKDLVSFFIELRIIYGKEFHNNTERLGVVEKLFENYNIGKLDIKRIYRYLDKNVKKEKNGVTDEDLEDDEDDLDG